MAWSKYDPTAPQQDPRQATTPEGARLAWILKWGTIVSWVMVALGFGFTAYWLWQAR